MGFSLLSRTRFVGAVGPSVFQGVFSCLHPSPSNSWNWSVCVRFPGEHARPLSGRLPSVPFVPTRLGSPQSSGSESRRSSDLFAPGLGWSTPVDRGWMRVRLSRRATLLPCESSLSPRYSALRVRDRGPPVTPRPWKVERVSEGRLGGGNGFRHLPRDTGPHGPLRPPDGPDLRD